MPFTLLDGILIFVMLASAILAMIRGFTREVFSIGSWLAAAVVTYFFWDDALPFVRNYIDDENLSLGVTIAGIFFITLLVVSLITMRISDFVLDSRAGPLDRTLGFIFGAARGLVLVVIAVLFLNFFIAADRQPNWIAEAKTKPWLDSLGSDLMAKLPEDPEAAIMEWSRGEQTAGPSASPPSPDATTPPEAAIDIDPDAAPPEEPGYATEDQLQLERQLEAPPPE
jgi:membrane protein required for colicin V production